MDPVSAGRILVVYDGSSIADRALQAAIDRATARDETIMLLAVMPPRLWRAKRGQYQIPGDKHDEEWARSQLARARDRCRDAGVHTEMLVRTGPPAHVIAEEASRGYVALFLASRPSLTGAPPLVRLVTVPPVCEIVAVE
jgi:nucleotide-binding universal stress UspA family protein